MNNEIEILLSNRHFLYTYVSRVFAAEPDEAFLSFVEDDHTQEECALLDDAKKRGFVLQQAVVAILSGMPEGDSKVECLRSEYTKLFIGPGKLPASPWESVYITGEPLLFQESTLKVREAYRAAGFEAAGYPHEADDHIAIELNFLAVLAQKTLDACAADDADTAKDLIDHQAQFLKKHILAWVNQFADRLTASKVSEFYSACANLASYVCKRDVDILNELLASL